MNISLKAARVNAGFRQADVAAKMHIDKATIVSWEKGRTAPRANQLKELSDLYDIPMDYIFLPTKTTLSSDVAS